jgi:hypothetical protein
MGTRGHIQSSSDVTARADLGAKLVALAGLGLVGYGILVFFRNFAGFVEIGLTASHMGATPEEIAAFSPQLYDYISHVQIALGGLIIALGLAVIALAWFGIRAGHRWAMWTAFVAPVTALIISLPAHYTFGLDTIGHLGPVYLVVLLLLAGTIIAYRELKML